MAGTSGMLVGTDHSGVDPDRPLGASGQVCVAAQLVQELLQGPVG